MLVRTYLSQSIVIYTTDGYMNMNLGSLKGGSVLTLPDFGPGLNSSVVWPMQEKMNLPGLSPRMVTEFYVGWITRWGNDVANTSSTFDAFWLEGKRSFLLRCALFVPLTSFRPFNESKRFCLHVYGIWWH